jgi:amidophosphoribosyltransferase
VEGVRHAIGADSLGYISTDEMIAATEQPADNLCAACFTGEYPIELPKETSMGKAVLETMLKNAATGTDVLAENDNVNAIRRP